MVCIHCGAELTSEARFCRRCGQRTAHASAGSVTEATTRHLETAANRPLPGQEFYAQPDPLAYQPSGQMQGGAGTPGTALEPAGQYRSKWAFAGLLIVAFISIISLAVAAKLWRHSGGIVRPPVLTVPMGPPAPPPPPPPGPPGGTAPGATVIGGPLIYPGALTTLQKGSMLQLQTKDSVDQVADWYIAQLKPTKVVRVAGSNAVLKAASAKVIITATGDGTSILLKQEHD